MRHSDAQPPWVRALGLALLLGTAGSVLAAWVPVASSDKVVYYLDRLVPAKIKGRITVWILRDYTKPQMLGDAPPHLSTKDQLDIDCANRQIRLLQRLDYPFHMAKGVPVRSAQGQEQWNAIPRDTVIAHMAGVACGEP